MSDAYRILAALGVLALASGARAGVSASLERDRVAAGETVRLLLQHDGSSNGQPDLSPLKRDFDLLGSSRGSSMQIVNGHASSQTQVDLLLAPKHDGVIQIPPLRWDGELSPALELTVGKGAAPGKPGAAGAAAHVFLTTSVAPTQPYVQAAAILTVKLYADQPLYEASLELPASADVLVKEFGKDSQGSELRNGRSYQVVERRYLLFPQHSGSLHLAGPVLNAKLVDTQSDAAIGNDPFFGGIFGRLRIPGLMNAVRPLHIDGDAVDLQVLPRPAGAVGTNWLPAQDVTLEETWPPTTASPHVGEPITRRLRLNALGLTGAQLPDLDTIMSVPDGIKAYPDQAQITDTPQEATILGSRAQDIALIAERPGHYVLPAVTVAWWDTTHNAARAAVLPARAVDVLPAGDAAGVGATPAPVATPILPGPANVAARATHAPDDHANPWPWISLAFALLWLATLLAWWRKRRSTPPAPAAAAAASPARPDAAAEFKAFQGACRANDAQMARRHLLAWATARWPEQAPLGLNRLSRLLDDPASSGLLRQLDRACYTNGAWQGEALARALPKPPARPSAQAPQPVLPEDLYR